MDKFVSEADCEKWNAMHELYDTVLNLKAKKMKDDKKKLLLKLDQWYQKDLAKAIQNRKEKHITHEEICKLMKWKLTRGKFRPRLEQLVQENSPESVEDASRKAFKKLPNLSAAVQALTVLKAIGPATASAVLAAGAPDVAAFMADESMLALPGLQPLAYTLNFYLQYMDQIKALVKRLNGDSKDWNAHKVEITLWTYQLAKTLQPDLFDSLSATGTKRSSDDGEDSKKKKIKT